MSSHTGHTYPVITQFDRRHLTISIIGTVTAGVLVLTARRTRHQSWTRLARAITGITLQVLAVAYLAYILRDDNRVNDEVLPFHVSDLLRHVVPVAVGTGNEYAVTITYFWGLLLNPMALLTPDAAWVMDRRVQETAYWFFHWVALIVPLVLTFGYGYKPTWKAYRFIAPVTLSWMGVAGVANKITGGNYGFFARPPRGRSIIDFFGPWPWYILTEIVLVAAAWAGMTWIWERKPSGTLSAHGLILRS